MYADGNKKPYLQIGWVFANVAIVSAIIVQENIMNWGWVESVSVLLCALAIFLWITQSARIALVAPIVAMWIASVPLFADYLSKPQPETLWFWLSTIVACALSVAGAPKNDIAHTGMAWSALVMNGAIALLCIL